MVNQTITCDVCGKQKGEVNHWYLASLLDDAATIYKWTTRREPAGFKHLCGQECVIKLLNSWMPIQVQQQ